MNQNSAKTLSLLLLTFLFFSPCLIMAQRVTVKTNELNLDLTKTLVNSGPLPEIRWIHPQLEFTSSTHSKIDLKATVISPNALKEIKLIIGSTRDESVIATKKISVTPRQSQYEINQQINLPDGPNYILIEVITEQDIVVSDRRQVLVGKESIENMVAVDRKDYALLFATDKYDHWNDLVNPVHDAQTIAKELQEKYNFQIDLLIDPTVEQIWKKLRDYNEKKFGPQDQLLIFFAGHGHFDDSFGEGYVVAKNSLHNDLSRTTYLSHNRLRSVINNISCNHILLTMDVCFGGTFDPVIARSRGLKENEVSPTEMLSRKWSHRTRKYLTSGGKEYVSDGVADRHSPFAGRLIESLRGIGGEDRILTLSELQADLEKLKQLPRLGSFGTDEPLSDFVFVGKR